MRPDDAVDPWSGETQEVAPGVTLIRLGGHFAGGQVLHWADRRLLLSGDIVQVIPDRSYVSFMYSYPNLIPLPPEVVDDIARRLEPWDFDTIVGAWWGRVVRNGKEAVRRSVRRYRAAVEGRLT
jgi:glyoxylase-like metal-dependent hydrolase (beta-lactamase superfamily II)